MRTDEIFARIAGDVMDAGNGNFGVRDITIGMTEELYCRLFPREVLIMGSAYTTLFGCKVKLLANRGLWWIVGYMGDVEEGE